MKISLGEILAAKAKKDAEKSKKADDGLPDRRHALRASVRELMSSMKDGDEEAATKALENAISIHTA